MEHVKVSGTDLQVSRIGLGTWAMGGSLWGGTDERQAIRTLHEALELGVTLIDTAPIYGFGKSETIVGKALASSAYRQRAVVATKLGLEWHGQEVNRNASADRIRIELEASLRRLGVERLGVYQVHWPDPETPAQETAEALAKLFDEEKIGAIGVSNYTPDQMRAFSNFAPLHTSQPPYNLFEREIEADVLPYCRQAGIATFMYGALCRGLLSGRMNADTRFDDDDIRMVDPKFRPRRFRQYLAAVRELERLARELGKSVLQLAVRWVLDQPGSDVALWGARDPAQLNPLAGVCDWQLSEAILARIDEIVAKYVLDPVGPGFMAPPTRRRPSCPNSSRSPRGT